MTRNSPYSEDEIKTYVPIICHEIATSSKGTARICQKHKENDERFPSNTVFFGWLNMHPWVAEQYARAKAAQAEYMADECLEIADDGKNDLVEGVLNKEVVMRSRLRIDTRKWVASKLLPKKYGEAVQMKVANHDGTDDPTMKHGLTEAAQSTLDQTLKLISGMRTPPSEDEGAEEVKG